jgi:hypothetical protein
MPKEASSHQSSLAFFVHTPNGGVHTNEVEVQLSLVEHFK